MSKIALLFSIDNFYICFLPDIAYSKIIEYKMITGEDIAIVFECQTPAALSGVDAEGSSMMKDGVKCRLELLNVDSANVGRQPFVKYRIHEFAILFRQYASLGYSSVSEPFHNGDKLDMLCAKSL